MLSIASFLSASDFWMEDACWSGRRTYSCETRKQTCIASNQKLLSTCERLTNVVHDYVLWHASMGVPGVSSLYIINTQAFVKRFWMHEETHGYEARKGPQDML
jgi:hypothetical protein